MNDKGEFLKTFNCDYKNDAIVFISSEENLVFEYSLTNDEIFFLDSPHESDNVGGLYGNISVCGDVIYLMPFNAQNMWRKVKDDEWRIVEAPNELKTEKFMGTIKHGEDLFLLGYKEGNIARINTGDCKLTNVKCDIKNVKDDHGFGYFGLDYECYDDKYYIPLMCDNKVVVLDVHSGRIQIIDVDSSCGGYSGIARDDTGFWISPRTGNCYIHYSYNGEIQEYKLPPEFNDNKMHFGGAFADGEYITFTSFNGYNFTFNKNDTDDYKIASPGILYRTEIGVRGTVMCDTEGKILLIDRSGLKKEIKLIIDDRKKEKYLQKKMKENHILRENNIITLESFLRVL